MSDWSLLSCIKNFLRKQTNPVEFSLKIILSSYQINHSILKFKLEMKTIAFFFTISLLIVLSSANGHVTPTGPGSFSNVHVYYQYSKRSGYTYKVVADMDFNLPSTLQ
jgi:hypothetical protein